MATGGRGRDRLTTHAAGIRPHFGVAATALIGVRKPLLRAIPAPTALS